MSQSGPLVRLLFGDLPRRSRRLTPDLHTLYAACAPLAFRRASRLLGDADEAWDVVHEVFERMAGEGIGGAAAIHPWAYVHRATVNGCVNRWRHRAMRRDPRTSAAEALAALGSEHGSGSRGVESRDLLAVLWDRLDDIGREVLVLRFIEAQTQDEIAVALGLARRTVGRRLNQLRELAEALARGGP